MREFAATTPEASAVEVYEGVESFDDFYKYVQDNCPEGIRLNTLTIPLDSVRMRIEEVKIDLARNREPVFTLQNAEDQKLRTTWEHVVANKRASLEKFWGQQAA
jgi:hypothetical protein